MKLNRQKIQEFYQNETEEDFVSKIIDRICSIIEQNDVQEKQEIELLTEEQLYNLAQKKSDDDNYGIFHKPTKTWVFFRARKDKLGLEENQICLCLKSAASCSSSKKELQERLKNSSFNQEKNYGFENFLEFQIKKL
jgi:hypothetical protein